MGREQTEGAPMIRYLTVPLLLMFALGLGAGWELHHGRSTPRDVWDDAAWWSKGVDEGLRIRRLSLSDVQPEACPAPPPAESLVRAVDNPATGDVDIYFEDGSSFSGRLAPPVKATKRGAVAAQENPPARVCWDSAALLLRSCP